jgi:hypothetical protein
MIAYKSDLSELINDIHSYTHEHMNGLCKVPKPPCCWLYDIDEYALRQRPSIFTAKHKINRRKPGDVLLMLAVLITSFTTLP